MSSWIVIVISLAIIGSLIIVSRKWGAARSKLKVQQKVIKSAEKRKAIDREIQNLSPSELADRLRRGL